MGIGDLISVGLIIAGAFFIFVGGIGMLRMPDVFMRMSATTKSATLGIGLMLLGTIIHFADFAISSRALAVIVFTLATAPVSAHMIGRAAYSDGVPLWKGTRYDDLKGRYDDERHIVASDDSL